MGESCTQSKKIYCHDTEFENFLLVYSVSILYMRVIKADRFYVFETGKYLCTHTTSGAL